MVRDELGIWVLKLVKLGGVIRVVTVVFLVLFLMGRDSLVLNSLYSSVCLKLHLNRRVWCFHPVTQLYLFLGVLMSSFCAVTRIKSVLWG